MGRKQQDFKRYTVTSALPYANGPLHIGHLAGVYVPADIYVRYLRSKGVDVLFIGGSDEHGVPITIKARQQGVTPQKIVDKYHKMNKRSFAEFGISFDIYSRTSNKIHHETAAEFFTTLYNKGEFIEKTTMQYFDEENNQFLADRYIMTFKEVFEFLNSDSVMAAGRLKSFQLSIFDPALDLKNIRMTIPRNVSCC